MKYNIGRDITIDNSFDNEDHQEQQMRSGSDDSASNTDDYALPDYESCSQGDIDQDGNEEIGPSSKDVTKGAVLSLLFALFLKHRLTKGCFGDLLHLLNIIVPKCVPKTNYFFDQMFFSDTIVKAHFYCPDCQTYVGEPSTVLFCERCQSAFEEKSLVESKCFFFSSSIGDQLKKILENDARVWDAIFSKKKSLFQDGTLKGEIYTGDLYKTPELRKFLFSGDNFSMAVATDGIRPFKSSKLEIWPILSSLWCGPKKPKVETYFVPFLREVENLFINGINWTLNGTNRLSKVIFPLVIADAPARAMVSNTMQFNAFYGCGYWLNKGETAGKGAGMVRVFPLSFPMHDKRTHQTTFQQAVEATRLGRPVQAIKGPTILFLVPLLNITGLIPDEMHCAYLGVVLQFIKLWLGSPGEPYYIPKCSLIDEELTNVKLPNEILRDFRNMANNLADWKASEFRNFLLFYSPIVLKKLLPPPNKVLQYELIYQYVFVFIQFPVINIL